ncbi:TatD family hydrolase [Sporosarcina aquimarina]|uniref:TatD family hydrolase n=1 Tax=Sporosarcina aquimarina TaxID=114975 RepID=A0ABU4G4A5_9BACL|nr:TatD family hydrolase [Sporosarcina aquimarina]MDW0111212.1 TatD family hydrolase [Sporosarcina aquimarina]
MNQRLIDAHIHLDMYDEAERIHLMDSLKDNSVNALIAVSNNYESSIHQLELSRSDSRIKPALGYHPEQQLPSEAEVQSILKLIDENHEKLIAIGEVGLPYYLRKEQPKLEITPYVELLETFIKKAVQWDLPIVLHAVYEDAGMVCNLLEKYRVSRAHFHWFKGSDDVLEKVLSNNYVISVTPDVTYKPKIQRLVKQTPLSQLMIETDGPWPFEGQFTGQTTQPSMMHESVRTIAELKELQPEVVYREIFETTKTFYRIMN